MSTELFTTLSEPCLLYASASASGSLGGPTEGDEIREIRSTGIAPASQGGGQSDCGVPASAESVVLNLIATNTIGASGQLAIGPEGSNPTVGGTPFAPIGMSVAVVPLNSEKVQVVAQGPAAVSTNMRLGAIGYLSTGVMINLVAVNPVAAGDLQGIRCG